MGVLLYSAIGLLLIDSLIEMALIATTVSWLHTRAGRDFIINPSNGAQFPLHGKPANLLLNQGHASNGAAGTAYIVICFFGFFILWMRSRQVKRSGSVQGVVKGFYTFWLVMTVLFTIYSLACLIYVLDTTYSHNNQHIDISLAASLPNEPYPNYVAYPKLEWAPQGWFTAVLALPLASSADRSDIRTHLDIMWGWQWNLIPMTVLGIIVTVLAFLDNMADKHRENRAAGEYRLANKGETSSA